MQKIRLDKFLSSQLNISRSDAKKLLRSGRVALSGEGALRPETQIDPSRDQVLMDGEPVEYKQFIYIMQYKPAGVVSASSDPQDRTVIDILPPELRRAGLFPAGRLDKDTTGFVLITDDGAFAHEILSPAHHVEKTYNVTLTREVTETESAQILSGMLLGEARLKPAKLRRLPAADGRPLYEIVLTEGRYHQIRRMFGSFGNPVLALHRTKIGSLALSGALKPGESRALTPQEVELLKQ